MFPRAAAGALYAVRMRIHWRIDSGASGSASGSLDHCADALTAAVLEAFADHEPATRANMMLRVVAPLRERLRDEPAPWEDTIGPVMLRRVE